VSQASQAEEVHATSAIGGLPAESFILLPTSFAADDQGIRRGTGIGVAGNIREC